MWQMMTIRNGSLDNNEAINGLKSDCKEFPAIFLWTFLTLEHSTSHKHHFTSIIFMTEWLAWRYLNPRKSLDLSLQTLADSTVLSSKKQPFHKCSQKSDMTYNHHLPKQVAKISNLIPENNNGTFSPFLIKLMGFDCIQFRVPTKTFN